MNAYICCFGDDVDKYLDLINDYWSHDLSLPKIFSITVLGLSDKYGFNNSKINKIIKSNSFLYMDEAGFFCESCKSISPAYSRKEFLHKLSVNSYVCKECVERQNEKYINQCLAIVNEYRENNIKQGEDFSFYEKLSYIDKIFILLWLSNIQSNSFILSEDSIYETITCRHVCDDIIKKLIQYKIVGKTQELPPMVCEANACLLKLERFDHSLSSVVIKEGFYISGIHNYECASLLKNRINEDIIYGVIKHSDLMCIEKVVRDIKEDSVYELIRHISNEYKLVIEPSNVLASLVSHVANKYSLSLLYYTFSYYAKEVLVYIQQVNKNANNFIIKNLFTKSVSNYIQRAEEKGWELKRTKNLPNTLEVSEFEAFISLNYLDGYINWSRISGMQVLETWLSKLVIKDDTNVLGYNNSIEN